MRRAVCFATLCGVLIAVAAASVATPALRIHPRPLKASSALRSALTRFEVVAAPTGLARAAPALNRHPASRRVSFLAFGHAFELDLERSESLFHPEYRDLEWTRERGLQPLGGASTAADGAHCYYRGRALGAGEDSWVAVSTCHGLHGLVHAHGEAFFVEPAHLHLEAAHVAAGEHLVYRLADLREEHPLECGVQQTAGESTVGLWAERQLRAAGARRLMTAAQKNVELLIVNDKMRYDQLGAQTHSHTASIVNIVSAFYENSGFSPSIAVHLKAQISWVHGDPFEPLPCFTQGCTAEEIDHTDLISQFHAWRANSSNVPVTHDNGHLLSGRDFALGVVGFAGVGAMCNSATSGGINQFTYSDPFSAATLAHEMGHNFGAHHDSGACPSTGFIMASSSSTLAVATRFSSCSLDFFSNWFAGANSSCLDNAAAASTPICGNGHVESGEACDCGSSNCTAIDSCCNGQTCQLVGGAVCSNAQPCCQNCQIVPASAARVCRPANSTTCDLAETCDGQSAECPLDITKGPGIVCDDASGNRGSCHEGRCKSFSSVCGAVPFQEQLRECAGQSYFNEQDGTGDQCGILWCGRPTGNSCYNLSRPVPDGVACTTGRQCRNNRCVLSAELSLYQWSANAWGACICNQETRTLFCARAATPTVEVHADACFGLSPPVTTRACSNFTPDCPPPSSPGDDSSSSGITVAGVTLQMMHLLLGVGGFVLVSGLGVLCCYKALTHGRAPNADFSTKGGDKEVEMDDLEATPRSPRSARSPRSLQSPRSPRVTEPLNRK
jgi:hypothetical protein